MTVTDIVLSYLVSQPITVVPIVGSWNKQQLAESIQAANRTIPLEVLNEIEKAANSGITH